jgi:hypothetical protein
MNGCGPPYYIPQSIRIGMTRNTKFLGRAFRVKAGMIGRHERPSLWSRRLAIAALAGLLAGPAVAQPGGRELLNSERIQQAFGSYGVEVLANDAKTRVTSLYSSDAGARTCRTFAVVRFPAAVDPAVAAEHAAIGAGGSIGAVFAANGWRVLKTHLAFGEVEASPRIAALMHVPVGTRLAEHAYVLDVAKAGKTLQYAALVEIHHPDYLRRADLERIYGKANAGDRRDLLEDLLASAAKAAQ